MFTASELHDMKPKLKMGMVGGGRDATIGVIHQMAARLDGKIDLVAGAFSSNAERSKLVGEERGLHPSRVYSDYRAMAEEEAKLPAGERIDFVSVVTPNHLHFPGREELSRDWVQRCLRQADDVGSWRSTRA